MSVTYWSGKSRGLCSQLRPQLWFVPRFWSRLQWQELPTYTLVFQELILSILTHRNNTLSYTATYRDNSLFPFWLPETTLSLLHLTSSSQPNENIYSLQLFFSCSTFLVRLASASKTTTEISSNHRKKQTTSMGEDTFLVTYIIKIL